ncbi:CapA family protein [Hymenobacter guriensis]|uniref:CapA family protein n=1 Tax=Hymenobacter guriensis TaxID=2793065 RepID=A0ABS0L5S6_9BACT|nr:CapA family protein [Hymenobacter guriensis]MBG8555426.1 CapA family protein [Hymenobacter guriensis]
MRISVVGDVLLARGVPTALSRDSAALHSTARQLWSGSRYVIGNLECPLTFAAQPAAKRFVFRATPAYAGWLRRLGLTHLSLANNHTLDQQLPGLRATARAVRGAGLGALGYQADSLAGCRPTLLGPDSSAAVFAWSAFRQQASGEGCVCGRDFATLCARVAAYKTLFPHRAVLVYLHWGHEYSAQPSAEQRRQAHQFIDCGADAVVGAHPHVVQPAELYRGRPIVYSLGNFIFDQRGRPGTDLALQADFDLEGGRVMATHLRPLQLRRAVPHPASAAARAALRRQLQPPRGQPATSRLADEEGGGWQLVSLAATPGEPPKPDFFSRQLTLPDSAGRPVRVRLRYLPHNGYYQALTQASGTESVRPLGFPVYYFGQGDVDNDGQTDLLVGPVKTTHFDSTVQRRLFVYRLVGGRWEPRWLGSKVVYRLRYFKAVRDAATGRTYVRTLEQQPDGRYCIGRYYWQGFGLVLDRFTYRHLLLDDAYLHFIS